MFLRRRKKLQIAQQRGNSIGVFSKGAKRNMFLDKHKNAWPQRSTIPQAFYINPEINPS
jgi:hypothetical protein